MYHGAGGCFTIDGQLLPAELLMCMLAEQATQLCRFGSTACKGIHFIQCLN